MYAVLFDRFFHHMVELKMFTSCVMNLSRVVVCLQPQILDHFYADKVTWEWSFQNFSEMIDIILNQVACPLGIVDFFTVLTLIFPFAYMKAHTIMFLLTHSWYVFWNSFIKDVDLLNTLTERWLWPPLMLWMEFTPWE